MPTINIKNHQSKTDLLVYETNIPGAADLLVYKTNSKLKALENEAIWYLEKLDTHSDRSIVFLNSEAAAELSVHFVNDEGSARWQNEHPLKGKLKS